jgi:hypothetical protein
VASPAVRADASSEGSQFQVFADDEGLTSAMGDPERGGERQPFDPTAPAV